MSVTITVKLPGKNRPLTQGQIIASPEMQKAFKQAVARYGSAMRRRFDQNSRGGGDGTWPPLALSTAEGRRQGGKGRGGVNFGGGRRTTAGNALNLGIGARSSLARDTSKDDGFQISGFNFGRLTAAPTTHSVLRDTGQLFNALPLGATTALPNGIRFGFPTKNHAPKAKKPKETNPPKRNKKGQRNALTFFESSDTPIGTLSVAELATIHHNGNVKGHLPARRILVQPTPEVARAIRASFKTAILATYRRERGTGR